MIKLIKKLIVKITSKDEYNKKLEYTLYLFSNKGSWKDYLTMQGGVTGLTPLDVKDYLDEAISETTLVETFKIIKELETRQIITKVSKTRDNVPIYRALLWFD